MEGLFLIIIAVAIVYWTLYELKKYNQQQQNGVPDDEVPYSSKRFRRRMLSSVIILSLLLLIGMRDIVGNMLHTPLLKLVYLSGGLVMAFYLFLLALADLAETTRLLREAQQELLQKSTEDLMGNLNLQEELKKAIENEKRKQAEAKITEEEK